MDRKKVQKIDRIKMTIRASVYLALGAYVLLAHEHALRTLNYVIGIVVFLESLEEFVVEIVEQSYKTEEHSLYHPFAYMIIAIIIILGANDSIAFLCIIWGIIAIMDSSKELNEAVHGKLKGWNLIKFFRSAAAIVFAVLLVFDPYEHVELHMKLLAMEYFLEAVLMFAREREGRISE